MIILLAVVYRVTALVLALRAETAEATVPQVSGSRIATPTDETPAKCQDDFSWLEVLVFGVTLLVLTLATAWHGTPIEASLLQTDTATAARLHIVTQAVRTELVSGHDQTIAAGSTWRQAGTLSQGTVFRPIDPASTGAERGNREAWPVINGGQITGYYLPALHAYAALSQPVALAMATADKA